MSYVSIHGITHVSRLLGSHTATYFMCFLASLPPYRMSVEEEDLHKDRQVGGHLSSLTAKTIRRRSRLLPSPSGSQFAFFSAAEAFLAILGPTQA